MCVYIYTFFKHRNLLEANFYIYQVPHKIWAGSAQPFRRLLDANKQTDTQTDRQYIYIDIDEYKDNNVKNAKLLKKRELFVLRLMWKFKFLSFGKYFQIEYVKLKYGEMTYILSKNVNVLAYKTFLTIENQKKKNILFTYHSKISYR